MSADLSGFLADRSILDEELVSAVRSDQDEALRLKELLIVDDLLSRAYAPERSDFANRVLKRTAMLHSQRHFISRVTAATTGSMAAPTGRPRRGQLVAATPSARFQRSPRHSPRSWLGPLAAAAIILVAIGTWIAGRGASMPPANSAVPVVALARLDAPASVTRDGIETTASPGADLRVGDRVSADRATAIAFTDGTRLSLAAGCRLRLQERGAIGTTIGLDDGTLRASVVHQADGMALMIVTPQARVRIIGTRFSLAVADGGTRLEVSEGRVGFTDVASGIESIVAAGASAVAGHVVAAVAPAPARTSLLDPCDDIRRWFESDNTPHSRMSHLVEPTGLVGSCLHFQAEPAANETPWAFAYIEPRDWRAWDGLSLGVKGTASGRHWIVEIIQREGGPDEDEHFVFEVTDDSAQWRVVTLPFSDFVRRGYQPAIHARQDGLKLDGMVAISVLFPAAIDLRVDQIELYGR